MNKKKPKRPCGLWIITGLLLLCGVLGFSTVTQTTGPNFIQIDLKNEQVLPNKAINQGFQGILPYSKMDFIIASGNTFASPNLITTASVRWIEGDGTQVSNNILTSGTPITNFLSNWASIVISNGATTRNFSGIIRVLK